MIGLSCGKQKGIATDRGSDRQTLNAVKPTDDFFGLPNV